MCGEQEPDNEIWVNFYLARLYLDFHTVCLKFAPGAEKNADMISFMIFVCLFQSPYFLLKDHEGRGIFLLRWRPSQDPDG